MRVDVALVSDKVTEFAGEACAVAVYENAFVGDLAM